MNLDAAKQKTVGGKTLFYSDEYSRSRNIYRNSSRSTHTKVSKWWKKTFLLWPHNVAYMCMRQKCQCSHYSIGKKRLTFSTKNGSLWIATVSLFLFGVKSTKATKCVLCFGSINPATIFPLPLAPLLFWKRKQPYLRIAEDGSASIRKSIFPKTDHAMLVSGKVSIMQYIRVDLLLASPVLHLLLAG